LADQDKFLEKDSYAILDIYNEKEDNFFDLFDKKIKDENIKN